MGEFKASNGLIVKRFPDRVSVLESHGLDGSLSVLGGDIADALREFFQHERDELLGRWRAEPGSDHVVYRVPDLNDSDGQYIRVVDEREGVVFGMWEEALGAVGAPDEFKATARAYFDAHPEPKPWHDAKPGEVWLVTKDDTEGEFAAVVSDPVVTGRTSFDAAAISFPVNDLRITAGRRIWPEATS